MTDINDWLRNIPLFTRYWLLLTGGFSLLGRFGIFEPATLVLLYEPFFKRFQIWRPFTALFFYPLNRGSGFHFLINCFFLYNYSMRLETGLYNGRPADYFFLLLFNWLCCVIIGLFFNIYLLMDCMVLSVLYIWCQLNKDTIVSFWFGTRFKAMYLPWVLFAFNLIINGSGMQELVGILVGHVYFFLMFKWPQELNGPVLLSTPSYLYKLFPNTRTNIQGFGEAPVRRGFQQPQEEQQPRTGGSGHNWGRGQVLGQH